MTKIALLDYGMGNLHSVSKALTNVGAEVSITNDPKSWLPLIKSSSLALVLCVIV